MTAFRASRRSVLGLAVGLTACSAGVKSAAAPGGYGWNRLLEAAPFPGSYGFPVHAATDGRFVAMHPQGTWSTRDGIAWVRESLPPAGSGNSYMPLVNHAGASWSLGIVHGNYQGFTIDPAVRRTSDYRAWEAVGTAANMPRLIFAAIASFRGALWLYGGFDGAGYSNAIWRSTDGLAWERVVEHAPFSPRTGPAWVVFRDRLWLIGGGKIDGPIRSEVWSSPDGLAWTRAAEKIHDQQPFGYTPQAFDNKLWLLGANRSGQFQSEMLVSDDGRNWHPARAPWSPRGLPAAWSDGKRLFLPGGKYSTPDLATGEPRFVYSNDVWAMARS